MAARNPVSINRRYRRFIGENVERTTHRKRRVGYVYDRSMLEHKMPETEDSTYHPERPGRISFVYTRLKKKGYLAEMKRVRSRTATDAEILAVHTQKHLFTVDAFKYMSEENLSNYQANAESVYANNSTTLAAKTAAGSTVKLAEAVWDGSLSSGIALVRPPGHHAEKNRPRGFCILNNIAIAAAALKEKGAKRILIFDWDIHHGNGTQEMFQNDDAVLFISIHRHDEGHFYPHCSDSDIAIGEKERDNTINIPWMEGGKENADYLYVFTRVVLPIIQQFNPEVVLVSAGFDPSEGDAFGGCCVTPPLYAAMTHSLLSFARGKLVLVLEGGYTKKNILDGMEACVAVLLGNSPDPSFVEGKVSERAIETAQKVISAHAPYWDCFSALASKKIVKKENLSLDGMGLHFLKQKLHVLGMVDIGSTADGMVCYATVPKKNLEKTLLLVHERGCTVPVPDTDGNLDTQKTQFYFPFLKYIRRAHMEDFMVVLVLLPRYTWKLEKTPRIDCSVLDAFEKNLEKIIGYTKADTRHLIASGMGHYLLERPLVREKYTFGTKLFFTMTHVLPNLPTKNTVTVVPSKKEAQTRLAFSENYGHCVSAGELHLAGPDDASPAFLDYAFKRIKDTEKSGV
ncbi:MAG: histone deacetylase clr3 [Amphiamblys sp. WSBS2006]|nr:MAG: histone deacetylase clr3 [Amphiamblys sp. WSBS2006]